MAEEIDFKLNLGFDLDEVDLTKSVKEISERVSTSVKKVLGDTLTELAGTFAASMKTEMESLKLSPVTGEAKSMSEVASWGDPSKVMSGGISPAEIRAIQEQNLKASQVVDDYLERGLRVTEDEHEATMSKRAKELKIKREEQTEREKKVGDAASGIAEGIAPNLMGKLTEIVGPEKMSGMMSTIGDKLSLGGGLTGGSAGSVLASGAATAGLAAVAQRAMELGSEFTGGWGESMSAARGTSAAGNVQLGAQLSMFKMFAPDVAEVSENLLEMGASSKEVSDSFGLINEMVPAGLPSIVASIKITVE